MTYSDHSGDDPEDVAAEIELMDCTSVVRIL
jgi:hypothetical protein